MSCDSPEVFGSIPLDVIILYLSDISWSCDLLLNSEGRQLPSLMYQTGRQLPRYDT